MYYDNNKKIIDVGGYLVEEDALRIVEAIKEYDPNIEVLCVNPEKADISEAPFVIAEKCRDGMLRPIFTCWTLDGSVLLRIKAADNQRLNTFDTMLQMEAKVQSDKNARYREEQAQRADVIQHVLADRHSSYSVRDTITGELVTFFDDRPATRK